MAAALALAGDGLALAYERERAMGCGASSSVVEAPSVEERPVDNPDRLRKAREDQRLVVERIFAAAREDAAQNEARMFTARECAQACEASRRAAAADRGEFYSAVGQLTTIATYERVDDLWLEPTKDERGNPLDEWTCDSCGQVNQFCEAPRCCTACGRPRESAGTDPATRAVRRSRLFEERKAMLEAELCQLTATVAATKPVAVQRGACCRMVKAVDSALAWLDTLTKPMGNADIDAMCAAQRTAQEKARAEYAAVSPFAQARARSKRTYLQAKGVAVYLRAEENAPLLFQAEHVEQDALDAQRTAENAFVQRTLSEGAAVSAAKDALLTTELQVVVGKRFKDAGDTRRAVAAQRAHLSKQKEELLIQIAETQPLVDEYRLAFKRLHHTIGALGFVLKLRASLGTREQQNDGRTEAITQLRHSAAEAQALEGGRQARRLGRAGACLAGGVLTATGGLEDLAVDRALDVIAERKAALEMSRKQSRRWSLEDEEAALHEEAVQYARLSAAESACAWLCSATDSRPREKQWITQCGRIAAAERLAAEAALTAAKLRAREARKERNLCHSQIAQMAGLCRAQHLAETAVRGTSDSTLNAGHHRVWRESIRALRRESEFQQLLADHATQRAACCLVERNDYLTKLHAARGEIMARNIVEQTDIGQAQQMNENLTLQIDSAMFSTAVASLQPTVKWHNAESECREGMKSALEVVADERERCASAELQSSESACRSAQDAEKEAIAQKVDAETKLKQGQDALAAAEATLKSLQARLAELEDLERAKGKKRDPVSRTVEGLEKTDGELTRSWTNLQDALTAELSGELHRKGLARHGQYQLKKPLQTSSTTAEGNQNGVGTRVHEEQPEPSSTIHAAVEPEVIELGSESTSEEETSPSSREDPNDNESSSQAMKILQGLGRPQLHDYTMTLNRAHVVQSGTSEIDADIDELRLMSIPSAEATVEDCNHNVKLLEDELARKLALLQEKITQHEAAEAALTRALRDHGREALRLAASKEAAQLDEEITKLDSSLTEYNIAERELRYANGALAYVTNVSQLADPSQSLQSVDGGEHTVASFRGVRSRKAPTRPSMVRWVREGIHVSDYIADYHGAGRQLRLEFIAHHAKQMVAELRNQGYDDLAKLHEKIELEACRILMDDLRASCKAMVALFHTYCEADQMLIAAKELYKQGKDDEDDRKMNQANQDMEEVLPVLQVTREQMMKQRVDAPLYRAIACQVNGRLGAKYTLDEKDDKVRVCSLRKKAALKALSDAKAELQRATDDAEAAVKHEKEMSKQHGRTKYSAERAQAAGEEAYKKDDYKKEREFRETAKELWEEAEQLGHKLAKSSEAAKKEQQAVHTAHATVVNIDAELAAAEKALRLTEIEARDGWLAKSDDAVSRIETFCTNQELLDAGLKGNHGDMVGAASSFFQWYRQRVSTSSRRKANDIDFRHGISAMAAALSSVVQRDLPSAQDCEEHRTWIVRVRCPKEIPKDRRFVVVERKSFTAADGSLRVDERHKPFGDYTFECPAKECIGKDGTFKTKVPMAVASRNNKLEGLTNQDAFSMVNGLSARLLDSTPSPTSQYVSPAKDGLAETSTSASGKKQLQVAVPATQSFLERSQILACRAICNLIQGDFASAADVFLRMHAVGDKCYQVACIFSDRDVALCATLCSLACVPLIDITERLLGTEFAMFLTQADPIIRELACEFVAGNLRAVESSLDALSVRMAYDPFISKHRTALVDGIRSRCCALTTPFVDNAALLSIKCRERAVAAVDSAKFRTNAIAAASELAVVKSRAAAAKKAASKAVADFHDLAEDSRVKTKMRNVFSRASAKAIAQQRFEAADSDSSGTVDVNELGQIAEALGHKLTPQQLRRVVEEVDVDGNGELDYNEFMAWYTKEFGEKLQMSQAQEARARVSMMAKTAQTELKIKQTKVAAEEAQEQVRQVAAEAADVKKNEENAARSRHLQALRQIMRAKLVLYYRLPCAPNKSQTQTAARLMLEDLEIAALEAQLLDEFNVRLSCIQRRHEIASGGIIFQRGIDVEVRERAVLDEVAAGGWSVDGISLVGYLRASAETKQCLVYIGSSVGDELARRIANHQLANAETARSALAVVLAAEQDTLKPAIIRSKDAISCDLQVVTPTKEAIVGLLDVELEKAIAAQGEYSAAELDRRRTKLTQHAMQAVVTEREQRALLQILQSALQFAAADLERKKTATGTAQEKELKSLAVMAAASLADAREIYAGAVLEREKKEDNYEKMRDQLTQEIEERDQLKTVARISEREAKLQAKLLADAVSGYDKKRIGSEKVDAEATAAQDASKAQRQVELAILVSEETDKVKEIVLAARKEEQAAASAIEECEAAEVHANETCVREWAEHSRQQQLREGPKFAASLEQIRNRLHGAERALESSKSGVQQSLQLAFRSQADFLREHALRRMLHAARRLWDEQATERLKERNHALVKRAALSGQVWADKSELFHKTDERAVADAIAATKEKARAAAVAMHAEASAEMKDSEVHCLQTKQTFTETKLARAKVEYLLEREEATLSRLEHQRLAGRPASASAVAKWRSDLERLSKEAEQQEALYTAATVRLERATTALQTSTAALTIANDEADDALARAALAAKKETEVQQTVAKKLQSLTQSGLVFTSERAENEFKSLLFRKMLDGALGTRWSKDDEARFRELFCGEHLKGPTSPAGLEFKKIRA